MKLRQSMHNHEKDYIKLSTEHFTLHMQIAPPDTIIYILMHNFFFPLDLIPIKTGIKSHNITMK